MKSFLNKLIIMFSRIGVKNKTLSQDINDLNNSMDRFTKQLELSYLGRFFKKVMSIKITFNDKTRRSNK